MSTLWERAADLHRGAMLELYDNTSTKVHTVVAVMIGTDRAPAITRAVYAELWKVLPQATVTDKTGFEELAVKTALAHCRRVLQQKDSKAFRLPADRQFVLRPAPAVSADASDVTDVVRALPPLHRTILVAHTVASLSDTGLTEVTRLDARTLAAARDAEALNVNAMLSSASGAPVADYEALVKELSALSIAVPTETEAIVTADIRLLAAPKEKEARKKLLTRVGIIVGICAVVIAFCLLIIWDMTKPDTELTSDDTTDPSASDTAEEPEVPELTYSTDYTATHIAEIAIQDHGTITVELDANMAPETVANFQSLADSRFYDGLTFHRIMEGFMMQGGDPNGNGSGGSSQNVTGEFAENGVENTLTHTRGAISMARAADYNSGSSQFFIVHKDSTFLDGQYAAFGYVTDGMDIVDTICTTAEPTDDNGSIPAEAQPIITSVTVREIS